MGGECHGRRSPQPAGAGRPTGTLSLLVGLAESFSSSLVPAEGSFSRSPTARSPRSFDFEGAVGLGIVAAMNGAGGNDAQAGGGAIARTPRAVAPRRSQPIPIISARPENWRREEKRVAMEEEEEEEDMELSESYTCVISHLEDGAVSKRVYFGDGSADPCGCCLGEFFVSPPPRPVFLSTTADFLSHCFRCSKNLHGLDIFMYRGEKAFCSVECRCLQMMSDERRGSWLPDSVNAFDCSPTPRSAAPLFFAAGVAAA